MTVKIRGLQCACGEVELVAVSPGQEERRYADLFLVDRPIQIHAWCVKCWPGFPKAETPAEEKGAS